MAQRKGNLKRKKINGKPIDSGARKRKTADVPVMVDHDTGEPVDAGKEAKDEKKSQATKIVELAIEVVEEFWHDQDGSGYATIPNYGHREHLQVRSRQFKEWLIYGYYAAYESVPNSQSMQEAIAALNARAEYGGSEQYDTFVRIAGDDRCIWLDLANEDWQAVRIDANGWQVVADPPIKFRRRADMRPLPTPRRGDLSRLWEFLNVSPEDRPLVAAWLVSAYRPTGPYTVLGTLGEQGSAKSTTQKVLRSLIDPNKAPLRRKPRETRDLAIAASNGWVCAFDNVSHLQEWLSDDLCSLATGAGFATRTLYSDDDEHVFDYMRPVLLNGITDFIDRPDLLDRSLLITPPKIEKYRTEREFWSAFEKARPQLLGAVLDAVSSAIRQLPEVRVEFLRMADFLEWATAAESAFGFEEGAVFAAYKRNRELARETAVDASIVAQQIIAHVNNVEGFSGTSAALAADLMPEAKPKDWPDTGPKMAAALKRCTPVLRESGVIVEYLKDARPRQWSFELANGSKNDDKHEPKNEQEFIPEENGTGNGDRPRARRKPVKHRSRSSD